MYVPWAARTEDNAGQGTAGGGGTIKAIWGILGKFLEFFSPTVFD